jgi:hypothetical protein
MSNAIPIPGVICEATVKGSEYHCGRCGYVWDIADPEPPTCRGGRVRTAEAGEYGFKRLREILKIDEGEK